ncbi:MAG: hypothetical protein CMD92_04355 [Gammaproteobacteria bacterium]|nr:hypothetical protein [Gammaproteobacteria bacterium]
MGKVNSWYLWRSSKAGWKVNELAEKAFIVTGANSSIRRNAAQRLPKKEQRWCWSLVILTKARLIKRESYLRRVLTQFIYSFLPAAL